jgi:hypothetical protein
MRRTDTSVSKGKQASNSEGNEATKDELEKSAESHALPEGFKLLLQEYIGCSVSEVFK